MIYYVDGNIARDGDGSLERPFKLINNAANIAKAGDEIIVAPGLYREYVNPQNSGEKEAPIVYRSEVPLGAIISGAEEVDHWELYQGDVWVTKIFNGVFNGYNPYVQRVEGDWCQGKFQYHTGEVYLNGKSMYEMETLEEVLNPKAYEESWEESSLTLYQWYTCQDGDYTVLYANFQGCNPNEEKVEINVRRNCFYPDKTGVNYITLSGFVVKQAATTWAPPTAYQEGMVGPHWSKGWIIEDCEISDSKCSGISLGKYLQPNNENKWSKYKTKHGTQTERDSICQAQYEGWTKELIGSHCIRRCHIHHCEQTGIVGHLGGVFSIIEDNHIHHINTKRQLKGEEIGGIKMHAAIDVVYRRNHIHHSMRGIWLDWQAQGTRVTQNLLHDNQPPKGCKNPGEINRSEDLFIEVSHGPTLVDNNIMLSYFSGRLATQGVAYVHNLIAGSYTSVGSGTHMLGTQSRYTPYHVPHGTAVNGFMNFLHGDQRFYNNIFVQQELPQLYMENGDDKKPKVNVIVGTHPFNDYPTEAQWKELFFTDKNVDEMTEEERDRFRKRYFDKLPVWTGGNAYFNGAVPCEKEENYRIIDELVEFKLEIKEDGGYLSTNLFERLADMKVGIISTETLGEAFEPEQKFENPDGSPIIFQRDYFDNHRGVSSIPGPFASVGRNSIKVI